MNPDLQKYVTISMVATSILMCRNPARSANPPVRHFRRPSFPRKRESICCRPSSSCYHTRRSITWIPAFAGMTTGRWIPKARMHPRPTAGMTKMAT